VPGTKPKFVRDLWASVRQFVEQPAFLFPGIGKGQGGDVAEAFAAVQTSPAYAIVGRGIYSEKNKRAAAERLWQTVVSAGLDTL